MRLPLCTSLAHLMDLLLLFSLSLSPFLLDSLLPFLLPSLHPTFLPSAYLCLLFHIIFNSSHVFSFIFVPLFFFSFSSNNPLPASHSLSFSLCSPSSFPSLPLRHVSVLSTCSFPYSLLSRPSTISLLSEPPFVSPTFLSVDLLLGSDKQALIPCQRSIKNTQPSKQ